MKTKEEILSRYFLNICTQYGFCLPVSLRQDLIANAGHSATDFVKRVIIAEGLRHDEAKAHFPELYSCLLNTIPPGFFDHERN